MASEKAHTLTVAGRTLHLTHPSRVFYPSTGTTKRHVIDYYRQIGPTLVRYTSQRPATQKRWMEGVGTASEPREGFFQKNLEAGAPEWLKRQAYRHRTHTTIYPVLNDVPSLLWLAHMGALEIHVPQWQFLGDGSRDAPDRLVLDLDPGPGAGLRECAAVAGWVREILADMGFTVLPLTSGSQGIHLYAPLPGGYSSDDISTMTHELARALELDHPDVVVAGMSRALRKGKVFVDWSQNNAAKTTVAPYSLRGRLRPTVAAPRTWEELDQADLRQLELPEVLERLERDGDLLSPLAPGQDKQRPATRGAETAPGAEATHRPAPAPASGTGTAPPSSDQAADQRNTDRLHLYRAKRLPEATPEPYPVGAPAPAARNPKTQDGTTQEGGPLFVIQEHHARRLHYDVRLERDGVLASWAVPKGMPSNARTNHLAIRTENHPLEYGGFEGTIPQGNYGAGEVRMWAKGTYRCEKWREGEEIIVVLHPEPGGSLEAPEGGLRVAFIHTDEQPGAEAKSRWLLHRMASQPRARRGVPPQEHPEANLRDRYRPMLAQAWNGTHGDALNTEDWVFDTKWDGYRAVATVADGRTRLWSRKGVELTAQFPELAAFAQQLEAQEGVFDGEIVAFDPEGKASFTALARRDEHRPPLRYVIFDVLSLEGQDVTAASYTLRRQLLESVLTPHPLFEASTLWEGPWEQALEKSVEAGAEGLVAKSRQSRYLSGHRSPQWLKIKVARTQEVVVIGWREKSGRTGLLSSLLVAVPEAPGGPLRYAGRVGTGLSERERVSIREELLALKRASAPARDIPTPDAREAQWVQPVRVGEVGYTQFTPDHRLRHPVWRGWRPDKSVDEVGVEHPAERGLVEAS